jgi:hypothetical protein
MTAEIKTGLEERNTTVLGANQGKTEATVEPSKWAMCTEATYMLTAPQRQASDVPHGAPKGLTLEKRRWARLNGHLDTHTHVSPATLAT